MVKAAIFMGDPRFEAGASYEIGTCTAGGVRLPQKLDFPHNLLANCIYNSLLRVHRALVAAVDLKFSRTVILPIRIAAMAIMRPLTGSMLMSMGRGQFPLLSPS